MGSCSSFAYLLHKESMKKEDEPIRYASIWGRVLTGIEPAAYHLYETAMAIQSNELQDHLVGAIGVEPMTNRL